MSENIEVIVKQVPGQVTWNFDDLKMALSEKMKEYSTTVYDDSAIKDAKSDLANLRKLRKEVESKRKEIKEECLKPYGIIEQQAKELVKLIDEPIDFIDGQVKAYEEERKQKVRQEIEEYREKAFEKCEATEVAIDRIKKITWQDSWLNVTTTKKTWKEAIDKAVEKANTDEQLLKTVDEEFNRNVRDVYERTLDVSEAMLKMQELKKVKEEALERKRRQLEAEAAQKLAMEQKKLEQEAMRKAEEKLRKEQQAESQPKPVEVQPNVEPEQIEQPAEKREPEDPNMARLTITLVGNKEEINRTVAFAKRHGLKVSW